MLVNTFARPYLSPLHTGDKLEFNMVDFIESRLLPKPATKSTVADTVDFVADTFNFVESFGNKLNSTRYGRLVADTVDVVASVYGAKATWLTVNKVDRVELNFVTSVYQALRIQFRILKIFKIRLITLKFMLSSPVKDIHLLIYYTIIHEAKNMKF